MSPDLINALVGIIAGALASLLSVLAAFLQTRFDIRIIGAGRTKTYNERITELTANLARASTEVDSILDEMANIIKERQAAVSTLEQEQTELQKKIDNLKNVPVEAAEFFTHYLVKQEQKSSRRDYLIFSLGVIVTTIISVIIAVALHFVLK